MSVMYLNCDCVLCAWMLIVYGAVSGVVTVLFLTLRYTVSLGITRPRKNLLMTDVRLHIIYEVNDAILNLGSEKETKIRTS